MHLTKLLLQSATAVHGARGCMIGARRRQPNSICLLLSLVGLNRSQTLAHQMATPFWQAFTSSCSQPPHSHFSHLASFSPPNVPSCLPLVRLPNTQCISTPTSPFCIYINKTVTCRHKRFCAFSLILPKKFCRSGSRILTIATEVQTKYNIFVQWKSARFLLLTWTERAFIPTLGPVQHGNSKFPTK